MSTPFKTRLSVLANAAVDMLAIKDLEYGSSWRRRGGIGAFMMLARKWDRLEEQVKKHNFDIFATFDADDRPEGILDDIRDLKNYLMLVEEHVLSLKATQVPSAPTSDAELQVDMDDFESDEPINPEEGLLSSVMKMSPQQRNDMMKKFIEFSSSDQPTASELHPK